MGSRSKRHGEAAARLFFLDGVRAGLGLIDHVGLLFAGAIVKADDVAARIGPALQRAGRRVRRTDGIEQCKQEKIYG